MVMVGFGGDDTMTFNMVGHENTKSQIKIALSSAVNRNMALPHMLFAGAAGCGKTTMAKQIAKIGGVNFIKLVPDDIKDYDSTIKALEHLNIEGYDPLGNRISQIKPTIIFFDEIHRMPLKGQEDLGRAMEEFRIESKRPGKYIWLPFFTVIGATTNDGKLSKPFRDRFKIRFVFQPYSMAESIDIVKMHAYNMNMIITDRAVRNIAKRGRGIPRIMVGYIERVRDMALSLGAKVVNNKIVNMTFGELGIDSEGLTTVESKILKHLHENYGKPIGLDNLSILVNEVPKTIIDSAEPFLIQKGFIIRSGKGRMLTEKGKKYVEGEHLRNRFVKEEIEEGYVRV